MVKYSAKKRTGSKKQSFKKRKYNKKKGGDGDNDKTPETPATSTTATPTTVTEKILKDGTKVTKKEDDKTRVTEMKVDTNSTELNMEPFCPEDDKIIQKGIENGEKIINTAEKLGRPPLTVQARIQNVLTPYNEKPGPDTYPEYDEDCKTPDKEKPTEEKEPADEEKEEKKLEKVFDDLIERILDQIDNICKKETKDERKEILENLILGKTE